VGWKIRRDETEKKAAFCSWLFSNLPSVSVSTVQHKLEIKETRLDKQTKIHLYSEYNPNVIIRVPERKRKKQEKNTEKKTNRSICSWSWKVSVVFIFECSQTV
jgi:hypothetical protein